MRLEERVIDDVIERATLRGSFTTSAGNTVDEYVDLRAVLVNAGDDRDHPLDGVRLVSWYRWAVEDASQRAEDELREKGSPMAYAYIIVGVGTFGAALLSDLCGEYRCVLWNGDKGHGMEWSGYTDLDGTYVILVDDIRTTGGTLARLRAACERAGAVVAGEVVAVDRLVDGEG